MVASIIIIDSSSKKMLKAKLPHLHKKEILQERFFLWHTKNRGVAYNKLENHPKFVLYLTGGFIGAIAIYLLSLTRQNGQKLQKLGCSFLLGGALGNFMDRLSNKGYVTDFLYIKKKNLPIFNIADVFVLIGGIISLIGSAIKK